MNRPHKPPPNFLAHSALGLLLLAFCWQEVNAAPAPFVRATLRPPQLYREDLVGTWTMVWGTHQCTVTLTADGGYTCQWFNQTYVGSWRLDQGGQFWITESNTPDNPHAWRSYAVNLDPVTISGRIEVGSPGVQLRFIRQRPTAKLR